MPSSPLISIITVCYNAEKTIEQTILSVLEQTYPRIEYIIVDGASNDTTLEIIGKYRDRIDHIISEPDQGYYDALNKGVQAANGDWIHQLNADDCYCDSECVQRALACINPKKLNYYKIRLLDIDGHIRHYFHKFSWWRMYYSGCIPHPTLLVSKEQHLSVGEYDRSLAIGGDVEFIFRLLKLYDPLPHPVAFVTMRQGGMSAVNSMVGFREFRESAIRHGQNPLLAWAIYYVKRMKSWIYGTHRKYR